MTDYYLNKVAAICSLGKDLSAINRALFGGGPSPLTLSDQFSPGRPKPIGQISTPLESADTRNNALLLTALAPLREDIEALKQSYGAQRIGVIIGSSTSGIAEGEQAVAEHEANGKMPSSFHYQQQEIGAPSQFVAQTLGVKGPAWTISTACTSGAKALSSAARLLNSGVVDAVICGGADSLCRLTVEGFSSLSACSDKLCLPFSKNRDGINIGEAAALFIMSRKPSAVRLRGYGETSDAHHISAPEPQGNGAVAAMELALQRAGLKATDIGYINLHGTATQQNDRMEALAVNRVFGQQTPCSSTKPLTGHTLGAAGALEAAFCWLALQNSQQQLPPHLWDSVYDNDIPELQGLGQLTTQQPLRYAISNSFAFGGNNAALILEHCHAQ